MDWAPFFGFFERIFRIWRGTAWGKGALFLIVGGVASINGVIQYIIPPVARLLGIIIVIPDTPTWVSLSLISLGILVLVLSRIIPDPAAGAKKPNPHDVKLLQDYRALITPPLIQFLTDHSFRMPYRRDTLDPLETIAYDWRGAHYEFQDTELQASLSTMIAAAKGLCRKVDERSYPDRGRPGVGTPLTDDDLRRGIQPGTRDAIKQMNELAKGVVAAANELERRARQKMPS
jgi:hypothetical protein